MTRDPLTARSIAAPSRPRGRPFSPCEPTTRSATMRFIESKRSWTGSRWRAACANRELEPFPLSSPDVLGQRTGFVIDDRAPGDLERQLDLAVVVALVPQ